jgi:hypothetical protein
MTLRRQNYFYKILFKEYLTLAQFLMVICKKVFMKKILLITFLLIYTLSLHAQKDTANLAAVQPQKEYLRSKSNVIISIYPVPVTANNFTIKTDKDVTFVKITNIIGQDIFRFQYSDPQQLTRISLDNPRRGLYLVTIIFSDGTKVVKKIMVEESK